MNKITKIMCLIILTVLIFDKVGFTAQIFKTKSNHIAVWSYFDVDLAKSALSDQRAMEKLVENGTAFIVYPGMRFVIVDRYKSWGEVRPLNETFTFWIQLGNLERE